MTWESNNPIDYSPSGDDIDTFAQKVKADIEQLYTLLDRVRTNDAGVGTSVPDVAGHQWRVDTSTNPETIYIRDVDNSEWVKVGYVAENFGHSAKDIGGIVGKGFNSFTLGKLADRPASAQHTDVFWAYDEGNIYIWNNGGWEIGMTMDFTFLKNMSDTIVQQKEVARSGAEKIPRLNENGVGEFDVTGSAGKIDGYVINISGLKDGQILAFDKARKEVINVDKDVFTEDSASIIGEANKLVKANQYGVIANDTTGNAAKIAYTPIVINADGLANNEALVYEAGSDSFKNKKIPILNTDGMLNVDITGNAAKIAGVSVGTDGSLADGEVLVYREAYKGFRNEPKSSVGSGKALTIKQDDELLDMYSGADAVSVNFTTRNMRLNAKQYIKGDVAYAKELPSNLYLVCTKGGTSAESAPPEFKAGAEDDVLTDGTVAWKVCRLASQDDLKNYVKDIEVSNGNLIVNNGKGERTTLASVSLNMLQRSHTYEVGDIAYTPLLKSYQRLECVVGGTTDSNDINVGASITGDKVQDNTVTWEIKDVRKADVTPESVLSYVKHRRIERDGDDVKLYWQDPENELTQWAKTIIVKKKNSYPTNIKDGTEVTVSTIRNEHKDVPYVDTQANSDKWFYRAFPVSTSGNVSYHENNRFGFWHYGLYIDREDGVESTCVHAVKGFENDGYRPIKMIFASNVENNILDMGDWFDVPFMPKPCALKHDGTVDYYLDTSDYNKKADGSANPNLNNVNYDGEMMMEWSPIYMKVESTPTRHYMYFCSEKLDDTYECYSAKKADGSYAEHFYTAIYEGRVVNSVLRSLSTGVDGNAPNNAAPTASTTMANERTHAKANGTGWDISVWADENLIRNLGILVMGRLNSAKAIGYSCGSKTDGLTHHIGRSNKKGMFFGHYTTSQYATKFFGMENFWGHRWRRTAGLITKNFKVYAKLTKSTADGSSVEGYNLDGTGYIDTGITVPSMSASYIADIANSKYGSVIPTDLTKYTGDTGTTSASSSTYYCDGGWSNGNTNALVAGGPVDDGSIAGLFAFAVSDAPSYAVWHIGASLSYKGF